VAILSDRLHQAPSTAHTFCSHGPCFDNACSTTSYGPSCDSSESSPHGHSGQGGLPGTSRSPSTHRRLNVSIDPFPDPVLCLCCACRPQLACSYGGQVRGPDEQWDLGACLSSRGSNVVTGKWVFTHKLHVDGSFDRYKARWVLRGSTQCPEVDYDKTFSPAMKPATVCTVLALAISRDWRVQQLDVKNVFFHGTLSETVFCSQPTGFTNPAHPDLVCRLRKSLYGLKQAPRAWYNRFATYLLSLGFIEAKADPSLFIFQRDADTVYLLLYVHDTILTASSTALLCRTISALQREFAMKDLGPLHHFHGITVERRSCGPSSPVRLSPSTVGLVGEQERGID
jgi:hypothetical protein